MKKEIEFKQVLDDLESFLNTSKGLRINFITRVTLYYGFWQSQPNYQISDRTFRKAIQTLILTGRVRCLIASSSGYKFAENSAEMQKYLKSTHHRAMEVLRRLSALKSQAEHDLGMQIDLDFNVTE